MKHARFEQEDIEKAQAIVSVFETGKPFGDYAALAVLDDGAGISYGVKQFTHRSGSLLAVVEKYLADGGPVGHEVIAERLPVLKRTTKTAIDKLAADAQFKKALKAAAITHKMRAAQDAAAFEKYMQPAIEECERLGFMLPLSLAVVFDSMVHGSWERFRDRVNKHRESFSGEKAWITAYVRTRHQWLLSVPRLKKAAYRTDFFIKQIALGRWELELPMVVHGVRLKEETFASRPESFDVTTGDIPGSRWAERPPLQSMPVGPDPKPAAQPSVQAGGPDNNPPDTSDQTGRDGRRAAPAEMVQPAKHEEADSLDRIEQRVNEIAERIDQAERIVVTAQTRTDKAKSLWTTVAGTAWQMAWAVAGVLAGVPREIWLVVAVVAGAMMLMFLYRQIAMGKLREGVQSPRFKVQGR